MISPLSEPVAPNYANQDEAMSEDIKQDINDSR